MKKIVCALIFTLSFPAFSQQWQLIEDLAPIESAASDFGINMVFADDMLVVSWPRIFTRNNDADSCGELVTYQKNGDNYEEIARLTAADLTGVCVNGDGFGFGLAYDNGKLAIGMPAGVRAGMGLAGGATDADSRVFITTFENGNWALQETLVASDLAVGKGMGFQLVMEGDLLLVHAHEYNTLFGFSFPVSTGVYVFEDSGSGYQQSQKLQENFNLFGQDFDYEQGQIIVGAWGEQAITQPGRIYIYEKQAGSWQNIQTIDDQRNSNLGNQIEIFGDTLAAGSVQAGGTGSVTVFSKDAAGNWAESQFIQASDNTFNDQFGISLRLDEDELIVGAGAGEDANITLGAVYTFIKDENGLFVEGQKLLASNPSNQFDRFAGNLIFNDSDLLVNSTSGGFNNGDVTSFHHFSRASTGGQTSYPVDSKVSGTWIPNGSDNQKISIEILPDGRAVMFASLNHQGENLWLLGVGEIGNNVIDFKQLTSTSGAQFGGAFNSNDVVRNNAGDGMLSFSLCNQAIFTYNLTGIETDEITLIKDVEIPGNECDSSNKALPNGVSGAWFDPNRSGEGFSNYLFTSKGVQMATITWYTYDADGNQMWLTGTGVVTEQSIDIAEMKKYTGANLFNGTTQATVMGTLSMRWNVCRNAVVEYDFSQANLGAAQLNLTQLTVLDNTICDLIK
jgi:hypothetical protein